MNRKGKMGELSPEEMSEWEARLAGEGMSAEVGEDKGKKALEEQIESDVESDSKETKIRAALQRYWVFRNPTKHGEHKQIAQEIAGSVGAREQDVDESMINEVGQEIDEWELMAAESLKRILGELGTKTTPNSKLVLNKLIREMRKFAEGCDNDALIGIAERQVNQIIGY